MFREITFGQFIFGRSPLHRMDPRLKLVLTMVFIILLFSAKTAVGFLIIALLIVVLYLIARIPFKLALKSIRPILPIIIFTTILNLFFITGEGNPLVSFYMIRIYKEGIVFVLVLSLRIICLIAGSSLLTYTTSPIELTDAIERLLSPLKKLRFPAHELAMMMTIALRFIPTLIEETGRIMDAQKSRGAELDTGKLKDRVKALVPILVPLFVSSFRRADELAIAMESRCYRGGEGRTRMKQLRYKRVDAYGLSVFLLVFAAVIAANAIFPHLL